MKTIFSTALLLISFVSYGQTAQAGTVQKSFTMDTNTLLVIFAVFLLMPLWILSNTFLTAAKRYYSDKVKSRALKVLIPLGLLLSSSSLFAQVKVPPAAAGLSANAMTILLICVIAAEVMLLVFFAHKTNDFIQKIDSGDVSDASPAVESGLLVWIREKWAAMNFKPIEEEYKIDTGHSYDGIRELDNIIPPWFTSAFLLTILFGAGYLYRYQIAKAAPMQVQEYENAVAMADLQHDEYLKTQANNIDESNVAILTGADLDAGKKTFTTICAACHRSDGGGMVGPNLTDDYWIHGGSLKNIFTTIKYGFPEKGMISWKEQLSPLQIAQAANYILTLHGTNPPDPKAKQGDLYVPEAAAPDSLGTKVIGKDTLSTSAMKPDTLIKK
jgi:cytochrome c oxidase cbb3-type subunit 3